MSKSQQDKPEPTSNTDWGLNDSAGGQRSQVRVALIMIVSLLGALGYFVYRKYDERGAGAVQAADFQADKPAATPESKGSTGAPSPTSAVSLFGPLDADSTESNASIADHTASGSSLPAGQSEPAVADWSLQPVADGAANPQSLDRPADRTISTAQSVPPQVEPREELVPVESEQVIDLFGVPEETAASQTTDSFEPVPDDQPTADNAQAIDLFGVPEETAASEAAATFDPASGGRRTVESEQATDPFAFPQGSPTSQATDSVEPPPSEQGAVDNERSLNLFGSPEEEAASQGTNPLEPSPAEQAATSPPPVNPFTRSEAEAANVPDADRSRSDPLSAEPDGAAWETELPARPTIEPLTVEQVEPSGPWPQEADVIRVNSDEQIGETTRQAAAFDDPFFPADGEAASEPESPPVHDSPGAPATLEMGAPAEQPARTAAPAPTMDWSSPAGGPSGEASSATAAASPFGTVRTTTRASESDPFAAAASSAPSAVNSFDEAVEVHTVQRGDSYWSIARRYYGGGRYFRALAAWNRSRIADPNDLRPGMKVLIPEQDVLQQRFPALLGGSYAPGQRTPSLRAGFFMSRDGQPMYRVGRNDTLSSIAEAHLGRASRWRQIYGMNRDRLQNADHLQLGLELRLPADASQSELVSRPGTFR
jgi:nucleoid-associated protein YgaU